MMFVKSSASSLRAEPRVEPNSIWVFVAEYISPDYAAIYTSIAATAQGVFIYDDANDIISIYVIARLPFIRLSCVYSRSGW